MIINKPIQKIVCKIHKTPMNIVLKTNGDEVAECKKCEKELKIADDRWSRAEQHPIEEMECSKKGICFFHADFHY